MSDLLSRVLVGHMREVVEQRERLLERMLTDPRGWGVLEHEQLDLERGSYRVEAELSGRVPFGEIHQHQRAADGTCAACG